MRRAGIVGGRFAYHLLRWIGRRVAWQEHCSGAAYRGRSKLEVLFGPRIWLDVAGKVVLDFGCGYGAEAVELAHRGARRVIGIDIRPEVLAAARRAASASGVTDRCMFSCGTDERVDVIVSLDGFEHYAQPQDVLRTMRRLIKDDGRVLICFGPTWFHPYGGHEFSVFPWAHLLFTERVLVRWRADAVDDRAAGFGGVRGGLNQMTLAGFEALVAASDFELASFAAVPIRRLRGIANRWTREFTTSVVRATLVPRPASSVRGRDRGLE